MKIKNFFLTFILSIAFLTGVAQGLVTVEKAPSVGISILYGDGKMLEYGQLGVLTSVRVAKKLRVYAQYTWTMGNSDVPWGNVSDWTNRTQTINTSWRSELYPGSLPESYTDTYYDQYESFGEVEQKKNTWTGGAMIQISKRSVPFSTHLRLGMGVTSYSKLRFKQVEDNYFMNDHYGLIGWDDYYSSYYSSYSTLSEEELKKITGELGLDFFYYMLAFGMSYQTSPSSFNFHIGLAF